VEDEDVARVQAITWRNASPPRRLAHHDKAPSEPGIFEVLKEVADEFSQVILQEHQDNKGKPAEVGRREAAYRACYGVITVALAEKGRIG